MRNCSNNFLEYTLTYFNKDDNFTSFICGLLPRYLLGSISIFNKEFNFF